MITNQKELYSFIDKIFKSHDFIRKGGEWYFYTDECVVVFGIGKSKWGGQYGTVLTTLIRAIEDKPFPKTNQSHIHGLGLEFLVDNREELERALDLEKVFNKDEREEIINKALKDTAIPFLFKISSVNGIKDALTKYDDLKYYVTLILKNYLESN
jgi:hypothetical protein